MLATQIERPKTAITGHWRFTQLHCKILRRDTIHKRDTTHKRVTSREHMEGKKRVRKLRMAYEAAWARLQHEQPGYSLAAEDAAFQAELLSWLQFHEAMTKKGIRYGKVGGMVKLQSDQLAQ